MAIVSNPSVFSQEVQIYETILDAQTHNLSRFSEGTIAVNAVYESKRSSGREAHWGSLLADITWNETYALCSYTAEDNDDYFHLPGVGSKILNTKASPFVVFTAPDRTYFFVSHDKELFILKNDEALKASLAPLELDSAAQLGPFLHCDRPRVATLGGDDRPQS